MKTRIVETTGLSSSGDINIGFSVEYKKHFFSKWEVLYTTDWVGQNDHSLVRLRKEKCQNLLKALRIRGAHKIRTILED